ncbi:MAG: hypothetical protein HC846_05665 [Blastocatellia bacterium]|nr:hypothetical protein [Blastocatellia bacterium]
MRQPQNSDLRLSLILSSIVAAFVFIIWTYGGKMLDFIHSFLATQTYFDITWQIILIFSLSLIIGYLKEKNLLFKLKWYLLGALVFWIGLMVFLAYYNMGVLFIPGMAAVFLTIIVIHIKNLIRIDYSLTEKLDEIISSNRSVGGKSGDLRLESGLRLLETLLPSSEAVVFEFDSQGELKPVGRLKTDKSKGSAVSRQNEWRNSVQLCEQALEAKETVVQVNEKIRARQKLPCL